MGKFARKRGTPFWDWLAAPDKNGCRNFEGGGHPGGYGSYRLNGKQMSAHVVAYVLTHGPVPPGMVVMHTCDNRRCCNPEHLRLGTQYQNMQDMRQKGRGTQGETHPKTQLTAVAVRRMRELWENGEADQDELAEMYGITQQAVSKIVNRKRWAHV